MRHLVVSALIAGTCWLNASVAQIADTTDDVVLPPGVLATGTPTELTPAPEPSVVDLGFFFGTEFQQRGRSLNSLDQTVAEMTAFLNQAFVDSGLALTVRVVYTAFFPQPLGGIGTRAAHSQLRDYSASIRGTVLTDYGVDAVVLIKATDDVDDLFGVATLGTEASLSDPATVPHAVVCLGAAPTSGLECFGRGGIFAHEVGHLFGAGHQVNADAGWGGAFPFSSASTCGGGTIVFSPVSAAVPIFSTSDFSVGVTPCGVAWTEGANGIDNARTVDLTRALMQDLRASIPVVGNLLIDSPTEFTVTEGDAPLALALSRDGDLSQPARVDLAVISNPANRHDVVINPARVIFGAGQAQASVELRIVDDSTFEQPETIEIGLRNPLRVATPAQSFKVTINDNDSPPPPPAPPPPSGGSGGGAIGVLPLMALLLLARRKRGVCPRAPPTHLRQ